MTVVEFDNQKLPPKIKDYLMWEWDERYWKFNLNRSIELEELIDIVEKTFEGWIAFGLSKQQILSNPDAYLAGFKFQIKFRDINEDECLMYFPIATIARHKDKKSVILTVKANLFSDFLVAKFGGEACPNVEFGEIIDFSEFGEINRNNFNSSISKLLKELNPVHLEISPKKGIYSSHFDEVTKQRNDWAAEEINENGFNPMTERKYEFEKAWESK